MHPDFQEPTNQKKAHDVVFGKRKDPKPERKLTKCGQLIVDIIGDYRPKYLFIFIRLLLSVVLFLMAVIYYGAIPNVRFLYYIHAITKNTFLFVLIFLECCCLSNDIKYWLGK